MTTEVATDLNAVIVSAVNARVESAVLEALSGDQFLSKYVGAALNEEVEYQSDGVYGKRRKTTFLKHTIASVVRQATKLAVERILADEVELMEKAVRAEIRKAAPQLAKQLTDSLAHAAKSAYGVEVKLKMPGDY